LANKLYHGDERENLYLGDPPFPFSRGSKRFTMK
jgi:hypothetical protein